jgi:hypothetical protein
VLQLRSCGHPFQQGTAIHTTQTATNVAVHAGKTSLPKTPKPQ